MLRAVIFVLFCCLACLAFTSAAPPVIEGRVVGGVDATIGQFPHQVSLRQSGSHICGGSIISRDYVLTAGHCVSSQFDNGTVSSITPASLLSIRAGTLDRFSGGMLINVEEVHVHDQYNSFWFDVAVLKLAQPLIFSSQLAPIPLATEDTPANSDVIISGWGRLTTGGDVPRTMQWNTLSAISKLSCALSIAVYRDDMLCLAHTSGNGACNGDSGGPAIFNGELVGIAGFVVGGCGSSSPDGYAKVFYHRDWIIQHANL
ncbi:serine protease SP24D-like [Drosophila sulfurigaster albostrigata]|uniref:serine protease SP24D-like n=1 Tax=Drosophila sulfurigaster albostrigata TaxID=89887 RepID=UPI002D21CFEE|nr:serine protease SP24D-like [Drosophila sulfurigaster albostrigata]